MHSFFKKTIRTAGRPASLLARNWLGSVVAVQTEAAVTAITFDDGPHPESTPEVLQTLARYGARATFFMVGELARRHPELVRDVARAGHAIGNHSWSHLSFPVLSERERGEQIRACEEALGPYGSRLFRPPYGHQTVPSRWTARRAGYEVILFSVHAEDWLDRPAEWMAERLLRRIAPGSIVILHDHIYRNILSDARPDRRAMLDALASALDRLRQRYAFVTVPELLRMGRPLRAHWYRRPPSEFDAILHSLRSRHPAPST